MAMNVNFMDAGLGLAIGAAAQLAANQTAKSKSTWEAANSGKVYPQYKRIDNYVSFGLPVIGVVAGMTNVIPISKNISDKLVLTGSVLAGQRIVQMMTNKNYQLQWSEAGAYKRTGSPSFRSTPPSFSRPAAWQPTNLPAGSSGEMTSSAGGIGSL